MFIPFDVQVERVIFTSSLPSFFFLDPLGTRKSRISPSSFPFVFARSSQLRIADGGRRRAPSFPPRVIQTRRGTPTATVGADTIETYHRRPLSLRSPTPANPLQESLIKSAPCRGRVASLIVLAPNCNAESTRLSLLFWSQRIVCSRCKEFCNGPMDKNVFCTCAKAFYAHPSKNGGGRRARNPRESERGGGEEDLNRRTSCASGI